MNAMQHITLIGYGEVGQIFAHTLQSKGLDVSAWDAKLLLPETAGPLQATATQHHIRLGRDMADALAGSALVISAVTASNTLQVAQSAATYIARGAYFLDLNSASPGTKQQARDAIEAAGAHYVEAGVMTSVPPYGIRVPMLLGGAQAAQLQPILANWGMDASVVSADVGVASATKMSRSIMIKGLEALVIESFSTARHYGVEDAMVATLQETFPGINWNEQAAYFFMRVAQHGKRRAEEMRESAATVAEAGFEPFMGAAIADKQQFVADQAAAGAFKAVPAKADWKTYADALLATRATPAQP
jgi:3-hydroxyisobutyrate dehydrogenase-like beta-hydroxyacid dehydrogenase